MLVTGLQTARALIALVLAISTPLALVGSDMHVEVQGCCDSADDYMVYMAGSSTEVILSAGSMSLARTGLAALISGDERNHPLPYLLAMIDETYICRERDGVPSSVDRPG